MLAVERNRIVSDDNEELVKVIDFSIFDEFDCGHSDLNGFIWEDASVHKKELIAETYLFQWLDLATPPIAFVSLLNDSITLTTNRERRLVPNRIRSYPEYPAVKIGRLGVDHKFQGQNIGTTVINMLKSLFITDNRTGCRFLTVEAYNTAGALAFYEKNDFRFFPDQEEQSPNQEEQSQIDTRLMFFDLAWYTEA